MRKYLDSRDWDLMYLGEHYLIEPIVVTIMTFMSLDKVKDEALEANRKCMVHGDSTHISIHMSYQTWSLPEVMELYLGGLWSL